MRLIIIGATGFIGNAVYRWAKARKISAVGTSALGSEEFFAYDLLKNKPPDLSEFLSDDAYALIAAGITNVNLCRERQDISHKINVVAVKALLDYFGEHNVKTVYLSSDAVFNGKKGNYVETDATDPLSVYGKQKLEVENYILQNYPQNLIYRLPKIVEHKNIPKNIFADFYNGYLNGKTIRCIKGLTFNPTLTEDIAKCIFAGIENKLSGLYHAANPRSYTRLRLAREFFGYKNITADITEEDAENFRFAEPYPLNISMISKKFMKDARNINFTPMSDVIEKFWISEKGQP